MARMIHMIREVLYGEGGLLVDSVTLGNPETPRREMTFDEFLAESAKIIERHKRRRE